ncbi:nuclear cap-binding protein subunit 3-like isoform X2 [Limulus polyphemus]|uniref:Nuclear cap-binding protein subunit 3 n=1 Tax=Limulus polyphemus TaxID=6850 RepID=A0ABM1BA45_LIMPO|nr:nuclear cap-binding protein subunit 3-like isoform X2 [Limulus polyphemus]
MAHFRIGSEELPNLKIAVENTPGEDEINVSTMEVSFSDDEQNVGSPRNVPIVGVNLDSLVKQNIQKYENPAGAFYTGLDLSSKEVHAKLEKRAQRFGFENEPQCQTTPEEINSLYKSLNIECDARDFNQNEPGKYKGYRLNAVHIRGVNDMCTQNVFDYFKEYGPASIEWVNDYSCNVVWLDNMGAARALIGCSKPMEIREKTEKHQSQNRDIKKEERIKGGSSDKGEEIVYMSDDEEDDTDDEENITDKIKEQEEKNVEKQERELMKSEVEKDEALPIEEKAAADNQKPELELSENSYTHTIQSEKKPESTNEKLEVPVPPGCWRLGNPTHKAKYLLLRFAGKEDRKIRGSEKSSLYYRKYGNPNYGGIISTSRKRRFRQQQEKQELQDVLEEVAMKKTSPDIDKQIQHMKTDLQKDLANRLGGVSSDHEDERPLIKVPRMKMYADEEEEKQKKKREAAAQKRNAPSPHDIRNRLPPRDRSNLPSDSDIISSEDSEAEVDLEPQKSGQRNCSVWDRLSSKQQVRDSDSDSEQDEVRYSGDLRKKLGSKFSLRSVVAVQGDLRSKLNRIRKDKPNNQYRSPLLVKVGNADSD